MRMALAVSIVALFLVACGGVAATPTANTPATQTRTRELAVIATADAPTATIQPTSTLTPTSVPKGYQGERWRGIPRPGTMTIVQEEAGRLTLATALSQDEARQLYQSALEMDGYIQYAANSSGSVQAYGYRKGNAEIAIGFGRDTGTTRTLIIIEDRSVASVRPTATSTKTPACSTSDGKKVYDLLKQFSQEWDDALRLADSTPRVALAPQIAKLQEIRRKVQAQTWPTCGQVAYGILIRSMDGYINGYLDFLGQGSKYFTLIETAKKDYATFLTELETITK